MPSGRRSSSTIRIEPTLRSLIIEAACAYGRLGVAGQHVAHGVHAAHVIAGLRRPLVPPRGPHRDEPVGSPELRDVGRKVGRKEHRDPGRLGTSS